LEVWASKTLVALMILCYLSGNGGMRRRKGGCGEIFWMQGMVLGGIWIAH